MKFSDAQKYILDKDRGARFWQNWVLRKTLRMFNYSFEIKEGQTGLYSSSSDGGGAPLPFDILEKQLQTQGYSFVFRHTDGVLYALQGGLSGLDAYGEPTDITLANPALKLNVTMPLSEGVLMQNDSLRMPLTDIIGYYAALLVDANISLNNAIIWGRITNVIIASDDRSTESARKYLENIEAGKNSIITENAFLKGINIQQATNAHAHITPLIEALQYYKGSLLNEIGLNANYNMKRDRLNESEVDLNTDQILPYPENMLYNRRKGIDEINKKFGMNIFVDLNTAWKMEKENSDKGIELLETETELDRGAKDESNRYTQ